MAENRGKKFEGIIKQAFEKVPNTLVIRLHDQTTGFKGSTNLCDFIVYHYPFQYLIECKTIHGNTFPLSNITDNQWKMLEAAKVQGVKAGVIVWWVDKDKTYFLPIQNLRVQKEEFEKKSIGLNYILDSPRTNWIEIKGKKKRVFFDYDMESFFEKAQ